MKRVQSMGIRLADKFIKDSAAMGYDISGTVFKVDYNGKDWTVGFWIRATKLNLAGEYELPGRMGRARKPDFDEAVLAAINIAKMGE